MKKILIFLITILGITFIPSLNVYAESTTFYESNYITGIWMNKKQGKTIYYQTARFFRETKNDNYVYCIEPFAMFNGDIKYESTLNPSNLTTDQIKKISLISHFGYGYTNHTANKWYAITQMMIWKEADSSGDYYFTDSLNGNRVNLYEDEMNEINNLINDYNKVPNIKNEYNIIEGQNLIITDYNDTLKYYNYIYSKTNNVEFYNKINPVNNINYSNNYIEAVNFKEGTYILNFTRKSTIYNRPIVFYEANGTQNMMKNGDLSKSFDIKINVIKTKLSLTKIDADTKSTTPSGEASLINTEYELYDSNMNKINTLKIDKNSNAIIENLSYGKYFLKEIKSGEGYTIDDKLYEFEISKNNTTVSLTLENNVIKKKIIINKKYGDGKTSNNEQNISFNIYDKNNKLIKTITTNEQGYVEITLPYGLYTIKQINSTEGYELSENINIDIKDSTDSVYNLYDYKIKVPNTKTNDYSNYLIITLLLIGNLIIYVKKRNNY